ncbi:MAG: leucine-rich repeat protein, partial [Acutalibacteraceae bacterium]
MENDQPTKTKLKRTLAWVMAVLMVLTAVPFSGFAADAEETTAETRYAVSQEHGETVASGSCGAQGDNVTYTLYEDSTLIIGGSGNMEDFEWEYEFYPNVPYAAYKVNEDDEGYDERVKAVIIENGVTSIGRYAFYGFESLESVTIADSVTSIADRAFQYCSKLESVTLSNNLTYLGENAFGGCSALKSIVIPESLTEFGYWNFADCTSLESVTLPETLEEIGTGAFSGCFALKGISIPENVKQIGNSAFYICKSLTSVTIPDSVISIADRAFQYCSKLESVTLSNNLTYLGENAFGGCSALRSIEIPESLTKFGYWTFADCTSLESITLPESFEEIGAGAFSGCTALKEINVPQSVKLIGNNAFIKCSGLEKITVNNPDCAVYSKAIPEETEIHGYKYSPAYDYAASNGNNFVSLGEAKEIESISISSMPNKTSYKQGASFKQDGLAITVHFSDGTTTEKTNAFTVSGFDSSNAGTCTLTVTYGDKTATFDVEIIEYVEPTIYAGETINVEIEGGNITYIKFVPTVTGTFTFTSLSDDDTYGYLYDAEKNEIMHNDDNDDDYNFSITYDLESGKTYYFGARYYSADRSGSFDVKLTCDRVICVHENTTEHAQQDATCTEDGYTAGVYCEDCGTWLSGHEVIIKHHTDEDGDNICDICGEEAKNITKSGNCGAQGANVTYTLYEDGELVISGSGDMANFDYYWEEDGERPLYANYSYYGEDYEYDEGADNTVKNVIIEDGVTSIGNEAFICFVALESVTIPESVTSIGYRAFSYCGNLTRVTVSGSMTSIGVSAFNYCRKLKDVYYTGSEEQWQSIRISDFNDCLTNATIHYNYVQVHAHDYIDTVTAPTCTADGYTTHTCSVCGDTYTDSVVPALGHSFTNYVSNGDATCTADGTKTAKCDRCDATNTVADTGSMLEHTPAEAVRENEIAATCKENGSYDE